MDKLSVGIGAISLELFFGDEWPATVRMKASWKRISRKVKVLCVMCMSLCTVLFIESRSLGLERKTGGRFHLQLHMCARPIANKYREGNMKRTLKRGLKVFELAGKEANETCVPWHDCFFCACLWQCHERICYYTMHLCGVCCLACHLVLCISNVWRACLFVLCKGMLSNGLIHSPIIYSSRTCPLVSVSWLRWPKVCPVLKHGPRSLAYVQVHGCANLQT